MTIPMASLIVRHLRPCARFLRSTDKLAPQVPACVADFIEEDVVGWYTNPGAALDVLVFTEQAMHLCGPAGTTTVPWRNIIGYDVPAEKRNAEGVKIRTVEGSVYVRMAGRNGPDGRFSDAFCLVMLLHALT
jgi:hypothetical protein